VGMSRQTRTSVLLTTAAQLPCRYLTGMSYQSYVNTGGTLSEEEAVAQRESWAACGAGPHRLGTANHTVLPGNTGQQAGCKFLKDVLAPACLVHNSQTSECCALACLPGPVLQRSCTTRSSSGSSPTSC